MVGHTEMEGSSDELFELVFTPLLRRTCACPLAGVSGIGRVVRVYRRPDTRVGFHCHGFPGGGNVSVARTEPLQTHALT